jgi:hypothetical protein
MKTNDLAIIGSVALATATLTVAAFLPNSLNAGDDNAPKQITHPKLVSHGVEFALAAVEHQAFKSGDEPVFELKAVNTTDQKVEATVLVCMTAMSPPSAFSRMVMAPRMLWEKSCPVVLGPNEATVISLATATKLPVNSTINVRLQPAVSQDAGANGKANDPMPMKIFDPSAIVALSFSTLAPTPGIALAGPRP